MPRYIVTITDEQKAKLEALRIKFGLRSHAETIRALISPDQPARMVSVPFAEAEVPNPHGNHAQYAQLPFGQIRKAQPKDTKR